MCSTCHGLAFCPSNCGSRARTMSNLKKLAFIILTEQKLSIQPLDEGGGPIARRWLLFAQQMYAILLLQEGYAAVDVPR